MNIVGRSFTPESFAVYVAGLTLASCAWKPSFVVRHNTGAPNLSQRPEGLTAQHIQNLKGYYEGLGWHSGPHLFVDDKQIWVFSPLTAPGVHTPSWNHVSFGVEQLGDYNVDDYNWGRGLAVRQNAVAAIAVLSHYGGIDSHTMKDHYEDAATTHRDCPGTTCRKGKAQFMDAVHDYIVANLV